MQSNDRVLELAMPLLGPTILGQPHPCLGTLKSGLGIRLLAVCLLACIARCVAIGVKNLASFHGGRAGSQFAKYSNFTAFILDVVPLEKSSTLELP